jgi:hypothetical protein
MACRSISRHTKHHRAGTVYLNLALLRQFLTDNQYLAVTQKVEEVDFVACRRCYSLGLVVSSIAQC